MGSGRPERIFADASTVRSRWPRTPSAAEARVSDAGQSCIIIQAEIGLTRDFRVAAASFPSTGREEPVERPVAAPRRVTMSRRRRLIFANVLWRRRAAVGAALRSAKVFRLRSSCWRISKARKCLRAATAGAQFSNYVIKSGDPIDGFLLQVLV